jgi:hypothetical protein
MSDEVDHATIKVLNRRLNDLQSEVGSLRVEIASIKANLEWNTKLTAALLISLLGMVLASLAKIL